jgi:hypothetical protein
MTAEGVVAEAPDLAIPAIFRRLVGYVSRLTDEQFSSFMQALNNLSPEQPTEEVTDRLFEVLPTGEGGSASGLLEFAISTRRLTSSLHVDVETIAAAVSRAAQPEVEGTSNTLGNRLIALLGSEFVAVREKAQALAAEGSLILLDAKCITDLRPVFATDGNSQGLDGFLVIHNLKLEVRGSSNDPIYVVLDHDAIEQLQSALKRAAEKEDRLAQLLEESNIRNLSVRSDR